MYLLPYETTICGMYNVQKIRSEIERAAIEYPLPPVITPYGHTLSNAFYVPPTEDYSDVPNFTQFINLNVGEGEPKLVVDGRKYTRYDERTQNIKITAENDFSFQCARMALTAHLLKGNYLAFSRLGDVPVKTFVRWITLAMAQRFNLALEAQINQSVICAFYYYGLIDPEVVNDPNVRQQLSPIISRVTGAPIDNVLQLAETIPPMQTAEDLANQLSTGAGTIRMGTLKYADLYEIIANSFIGVNYRENCGVALEHLPTFVAMVYAALSERSYRKTILTKRAETAGKLNDQKQFVDNVYRLISEQYKLV